MNNCFLPLFYYTVYKITSRTAIRIPLRIIDRLKWTLYDLVSPRNNISLRIDSSMAVPAGTLGARGRYIDCYYCYLVNVTLDMPPVYTVEYILCTVQT